jgi:Tfp pilus assembly protein PilO
VNLKQRGPLVVGLAGAALIVLLVVGLILPKAGQIGDRNKQLDAAKSEQTALTVQLEQLRALAKEEPENRRRLEQLITAVPEVADLPGMIRLLNGAAGEADVDFMSVAPGVPTAPTGARVSTIPTQITVLGRYFAIDEFLRRLEALPRVSKVTNVTVNPGPGGVPQLQMNLTAEFYTTDASAGPGSSPGHTEAVPAPAPSPQTVEGA